MSFSYSRIQCRAPHNVFSCQISPISLCLWQFPGLALFFMTWRVLRCIGQLSHKPPPSLQSGFVWSLSHDSVHFSHSVVSNSLRPHESQHARPPYPSPIPGVHSNSHPSGRWCHSAISSSVIPFSSCPQSLPSSESFPMSQLFAWGGQSTGVSALASFLPKKSQGWSPLEWLDWVYRCGEKNTSEMKCFSHHTISGVHDIHMTWECELLSLV